MNPRAIWSVAAAEMRMNRRLVRTWLFIVVTLFFSIGILFNGFMLFAAQSPISSATLLNSPLMIPYQLYPALIGFFAIWVIFLAFDVRSRDKRDRLDEVIGVLPVSNLELVLGRATGITVLMMIPIVGLIALYWIAGIVLRFSLPGEGLREPELYVTLASIFIDLVPNILFWVALVMMITLLVRLRVIAAAIALGLLGITVWAQNNLPIYVLNFINTYTAAHFLPSFVAPTFTNLEIIPHRLGMLFLSFAFLCFAAALYPRLDKGNKPRLLISGFALICLGVASFWLVHLQFQGEFTSRQEMAATHKPYADWHQVDVDSLAGRVELRPGSSTLIEFSVEMTSLERFDTDEEILISLNPGYEIQSLEINRQSADFRFENGLLSIKVPTPIDRARRITLAINAHGDLNQEFAYLDTAIDMLSSDVFQAFGLLFQGADAYINSSRYVALVPDLAWYPLPGAHFNRDLKHIRPRDFFEMDLEVVLPDDWHVAGPGQSNIVDVGDSRLVRLNPLAPVHEIALLAAAFARRTTEIEGVEFELLVTPNSLTNIDIFEPVLDELKVHVQEMLVTAVGSGLSYPYHTFTIVETPINLRAYRGGWRMDTAQSFPGVFAIREGSFLQAGFKPSLDGWEDDTEITDEEKREKILALLTGYFKNDVNGGNIYLAASNNLMQYQTDASGPGAIPLSYLVNYLTKSISTDLEGFYSAHVSMSPASTGTSNVGVAALAQNRDVQSLSRLYYDWYINQPDVWEAMLARPLGQVAYEELPDSKTNLHVLHLWGRAMGHLMRDWLGDEHLGELLSELRSRYTGTTYTFEDLVTVAADVGIDITPIFGDWLTKTHFAGFRASPVTTVRLPDQAYGVPLYESSFYLENAEPVPGLVTVEYATEQDYSVDQRGELTPPIKISGSESVQIALTSEQPLNIVRVNPYLSYNRTSFSLEVPYRRIYDQVERGEKPLMQPASWQYDPGNSIVVDDLDPGFSVDISDEESTQLPWILRLATAAFGERPKDQGLTSYGTTGFSPIFGEWARQQLDQAYGKYRRTLARAIKDTTPANVHFEANLPTNGNWKLEYHVPDANSIVGGLGFSAGAFAVNIRTGSSRRRARWGDFKMWVTDGERVLPIEFDGESIDEGWNLLGEFDLENPLVTVSVSTSTTQGSVVADAIRWTPAS
ncbi:MAG: hypothetical protein OXG15_16675 [Gammaproteobacteria bacterium]|nr:hypothetical protein [Gammaproteobacteria bacterium]